MPYDATQKELKAEAIAAKAAAGERRNSERIERVVS